MILSYVDILGDGERHSIKATITTEHPNSSYGQPVLLLGDGKPLNAESWFLMAYQVVKATPALALSAKCPHAGGIKSLPQREPLAG